jgi:hypothetical protein
MKQKIKYSDGNGMRLLKRLKSLLVNQGKYASYNIVMIIVPVKKSYKNAILDNDENSSINLYLTEIEQIKLSALLKEILKILNSVNNDER